MRTNRARVFILALIAAAGILLADWHVSAAAPQPTTDEQALKSLAALRPVDVHVYVFKTDLAFQAMLEKLNLKLINILVMDDTLPYRRALQPQIDDAWKLVRSGKGHVVGQTVGEA